MKVDWEKMDGSQRFLQYLSYYHNQNEINRWLASHIGRKDDEISALKKEIGKLKARVTRIEKKI